MVACTVVGTVVVVAGTVVVVAGTVVVTVVVVVCLVVVAGRDLGIAHCGSKDLVLAGHIHFSSSPTLVQPYAMASQSSSQHELAAWYTPFGASVVVVVVVVVTAAALGVSSQSGRLLLASVGHTQSRLAPISVHP